MKLLIIHAEKDFCKEFKTYFQHKGFDIEINHDIESLLNNQNIGNILVQFDVIFSELRDDKIEGFELLDYINVLGAHTAVIFLSYTNSIELLSKAFGRGCEDYLRTPFSFKEIELRAVKAVRKKIKQHEIALTKDYIYLFSEKAVYNHDKYIKLTKTELKILYILITYNNRIISHEKIINFVWREKEILQNTLSAHIKNLKSKINYLPLESIKGVGYTLKI